MEEFAAFAQFDDIVPADQRKPQRLALSDANIQLAKRHVHVIDINEIIVAAF